MSRQRGLMLGDDLRQVGVALDVRTYEFATLYADVIGGNFQMYTLQWVGGALADPDILRQVFHSAQTPPNGFNRGFFRDARVDALLDRASISTDPTERRALFAEVQRLVADQVPYISLWNKTNVAVAQRTVTGVQLSPIADFFFLKGVQRVRRGAAN